jgi:hypothetical protein
MLKNKDGFQVNISLSIFFIAFCDLFTDFPSYIKHSGSVCDSKVMNDLEDVSSNIKELMIMKLIISCKEHFYLCRSGDCARHKSRKAKRR